MNKKLICKQINEALPDEQKAADDYDELAWNLRNNKEAKETVEEIASDERQHNRLLYFLKAKFC